MRRTGATNGVYVRLYIHAPNNILFPRLFHFCSTRQNTKPKYSSYLLRYSTTNPIISPHLRSRTAISSKRRVRRQRANAVSVFICARAWFSSVNFGQFSHKQLAMILLFSLCYHGLLSKCRNETRTQGSVLWYTLERRRRAIQSRKSATKGSKDEKESPKRARAGIATFAIGTRFGSRFSADSGFAESATLQRLSRVCDGDLSWKRNVMSATTPTFSDLVNEQKVKNLLEDWESLKDVTVVISLLDLWRISAVRNELYIVDNARYLIMTTSTESTNSEDSSALLGLLHIPEGKSPKTLAKTEAHIRSGDFFPPMMILRRRMTQPPRLMRYQVRQRQVSKRPIIDPRCFATQKDAQ